MYPKLIALDAANTLIHKPALFPAWCDTLERHGHTVPAPHLQRTHKLVSECTVFPDRTSEAFYGEFNAKVLLGLGVIPTPELLDALFEACSYLPWEPFADTEVLAQLPVPVVVWSNFKGTLKTLLEGFFGDLFQTFVISEEVGCAKPTRAFYRKALSMSPHAPEDVLYIGDSPRLDIMPAQALGVSSKLIDRDQVYPYADGRMTTLRELLKMFPDPSESTSRP